MWLGVPVMGMPVSFRLRTSVMSWTWLVVWHAGHVMVLVFGALVSLVPHSGQSPMMMRSSSGVSAVSMVSAVRTTQFHYKECYNANYCYSRSAIIGQV